MLRITKEASLNTQKLLGNLFRLRNHDLQSFISKEIISTALLKFYNHLYRRPIFTIPDITKELGYSKQTTNILVSKLIDEKIITETTGQQRYRVYSYSQLLNILKSENL